MTWDPEDLPESYYILGTVHGFRFVLDIAEGERVGSFLDNYALPQNDKRFPYFLRFKDYAEAVARVQVELIDSYYLSTPESRAFEKALTEDAHKKGWNKDDDD